jgi:putative membrane protein
MMNERFFGMGWGMWFIPLLIIVLIFFILKFNNTSIRHDTPLDILKKRYANGEITKEQFEEMKNNIS